jgi:hypothetical protein
MAVADALTREARSEDERVFLMAELALEVLRVRPQTAQGSLTTSEVRKALREVAEELVNRLALAKKPKIGSLRHYLDNVLRRLGEN